MDATEFSEDVEEGDIAEDTDIYTLPNYCLDNICMLRWKAIDEMNVEKV